jgi:ATP-dependent Lon protease
MRAADAPFRCPLSQDAAKLADLGASLCSADEGALQEVLESTNVLRRLQTTLVLLKKEMELSRLQARAARETCIVRECVCARAHTQIERE